MSEEEIIEENIRRYIKEHSTTIKAYTQKYVDDLQNQLQQKENIIKEVRKMLYKRDKDDYDIYTANVLCDIQSDFEEILRIEDRKSVV